MIKRFFEDAPVALVRIDINTGKFLTANHYAANMLGYDSAKELLECELEICPVNDKEEFLQELKICGAVENKELNLQIPNGQNIWIAANLHINSDGTCAEGVIRDITKVIKLKEKQLTTLKYLGSKLDKYQLVSQSIE